MLDNEVEFPGSQAVQTDCRLNSFSKPSASTVIMPKKKKAVKKGKGGSPHKTLAEEEKEKEKEGRKEVGMRRRIKQEEG